MRRALRVAGYTFRINTPPASPSSLDQRDGTGSMAVGALTNDTSITFRAVVNDLDNATIASTDTIGIKVEVKPVGTSFDGTGLAASPLVAEGGTASLTVSGLTPGTSYHWRAEAIDSHNALVVGQFRRERGVGDGFQDSFGGSRR